MGWDDKYPCGACGGSGKERCPRCQGYGFLPATCGGCGGGGKEYGGPNDCRRCNGLGKEPDRCHSCSGGYCSCMRCGGTGRC